MRSFALFFALAAAAFGQTELRTAEEFYGRAQQSLAQKQTDRAIEDCTLAISAEPDFYEALLLRASLFSQSNQPEKAAADLGAVLKMHPRASTFVFRGNMYMQLKNYAAAQADFSEAIRRLPNGPTAYRMRANAKEQMGDAAGANADRARAMELAAVQAATPVNESPQKTSVSPGDVLRIGGGVSPPKVLAQHEPSYTEEARKAKIQGSVTLQVVIDNQGNARDFKVVRSLGYGLDEKAIEAVGQWKFRPGIKDGSPVAVYSTIEVNFRLL